MGIRFINCEFCQTEGRILRSNGGPHDIDCGVCPECNGECVVEVKTEPVTPEDWDDDEPRCDCGHLFEICCHPNCF